MSDLFSQAMKTSGTQGIADQDCRIWAERLMRDVNEEVSRDERQERDFITAWIRWTDLVSLVSFMDLSLYRREDIAAEDLKWHRMLTTGLIALGGTIEKWSSSFGRETLALASYDAAKLETMIQSIQSSFEDFHSERSGRISAEISKLLPP